MREPAEGDGLPLERVNPTVKQVAWERFDVPRLHSMLREEPVEDGGMLAQQIDGFTHLAQQMESFHGRLADLRGRLEAAWDPQRSPAAARFFEAFDDLVSSVEADAFAHGTTARALDGIMLTLRSAKNDVGDMKLQWDKVTTDWRPEWWDNAAQELNGQATEVISRADKAIGDYSSAILLAELYQPPVIGDPGPITDPPHQPKGGSTPSGGSAGGSASGGATAAGSTFGAGQNPAGARQPVPAIPGYDPIVNRGPELQGFTDLPARVPAVPGSPISVLPVPPGNPYAPGGGAYVLPGPGVGRGGWISPMPPKPGAVAPSGMAAGRGGLTPTAAGPAAGSAAGGAGVPLNGQGSGRSDERTRRPGARDLIWEVAKGVPPLIGDDPYEEAEAQAQKGELDEAFGDWFADVASPWDKEMKVSLDRPGAAPVQP